MSEYRSISFTVTELDALFQLVRHGLTTITWPDAFYQDRGLSAVDKIERCQRKMPRKPTPPPRNGYGVHRGPGLNLGRNDPACAED